jgi:hypothetical protein
MRFISASSVVFGVVLLARPAFSTEFWWVDKTCDEKLGKDVVHRMMEETVESAKMIRDRLIRSERDEPDAHRAFQALFQFKTSTDEPWDKSRWEIFQSSCLNMYTRCLAHNFRDPWRI